MKVTHVRYSMLRKTANFENDRVEVEVELGAKDTPEEAYKFAAAQCQLGLQVGQRADLGRRFDQLAEILCDDEGALAFKQFVTRHYARVRREGLGDI